MILNGFVRTIPSPILKIQPNLPFWSKFDSKTWLIKGHKVPKFGENPAFSHTLNFGGRYCFKRDSLGCMVGRLHLSNHSPIHAMKAVVGARCIAPTPNSLQITRARYIVPLQTHNSHGYMNDYRILNFSGSQKITEGIYVGIWRAKPWAWHAMPLQEPSWTY